VLLCVRACEAVDVPQAHALQLLARDSPRGVEMAYTMRNTTTPNKHEYNNEVLTTREKRNEGALRTHDAGHAVSRDLPDAEEAKNVINAIAAHSESQQGRQLAIAQKALGSAGEGVTYAWKYLAMACRRVRHHA
jgi:hypothetical protein